MVTRKGILGRGLRALCLASAAFIVVDSASAAETDAAAPAGKTLEELVVTARFAKENVQSVPITDNVLSTTDLQNRNVVRLTDLAGLVPNFQWDNSGGSSVNENLKMTMRGIDSGASQSGLEPGIGIYVDDVYLGDDLGFNNSLLDVNEIEVLKGPQGTRFGRNTVAGAISIHTIRPSFSDQTSEVEAGVGNYNLYEFKGFTNLPLADNLALKLSGIVRQRDGYLFNVVDGKQDLNNEDHFGGRAQLLWAPTSTLNLLFTADYFHDRGDDEGQVCFGTGKKPTFYTACNSAISPITILGVTIPTVNHPTIANISDGQAADNGSITRREMWSTSLNADWEAGGGNHLTSISSYRSLTASNDQDQDYTPLNLFRSGYNVPKDWQFSQELRLTTPETKQLRGVGGLFYFHEDRDAILPQDYTSLVLQVVGEPVGTPDQRTNTDADQVTDSLGAYGQVTYDITSTLSADLGARWTEDWKRFAYQESVDPLLLTQPLNSLLGIPVVVPLTHDHDSWGKATGNVSLDWKPTPDALLYLRYSTGFKSGGYNSQLTSDTFTLTTKPFGPEEMGQWETGAKLEGFDHRIRFNVAAFSMRYTNIQTEIEEPDTSLKYIINGGGAESKGVEVEFAAVPFPALTLEANAGLLHAKFTSFPAGGETDLVGKELYFSPKANATFSATYRQALPGGWSGLASATAVYRSAMWLDDANTENSPGDTTARGRLELTEPHARWSVALWGDNLTDVRRITSETHGKFTIDGGAARLTDPRTFGLEVKAHF
jgi:iron complex outermembrane recepter protein